MRVGVALGAGGAVGVAFHGGVLAALQEATGWDPRAAEVLVGTSAGSLSASLLRLGLTTADLRAVSEGQPLSDVGQLVAGPGGPRRPRTDLRAFLRPRPPASVTAAARGLLDPRGRLPLALAAALLPPGPVPMTAMSAGIDRVAGGEWPDRELWLCSVRLRDGRGVVFGRAGDPRAPLGLAVAASCAVPAYYEPVRIDGERFVDGGVSSLHHAGLLHPRQLDLVVVSAPMAHTAAPGGARAAGPLRRYARRQLDRELVALRRAGVPVLVLAPTRRVVTAMGTDPLDARRRAMVSRLAHRATLDYLERPAARELLAGLTGQAPARPAGSPAA